MSHFLLELGVEELPAVAVQKAMSDLRDALYSELVEAGLSPQSCRAFSTPRRLIVGIEGLQDRQPDVIKEQRGPALKAAFDAEGNPTGALLGFCRSQGVDVATIRKDDQYVWISKTILGRSCLEILQDAVPKTIRGLAFAKTMRWGASRMRFARPIRWIVASLDKECVPFSIETVHSGLESRGHRFYAPANFPATNFDGLIDDLRAQFVEPDASVRRKMILDGIEQVTKGEAQVDPTLLEENVNLTEWPTTIRGEFPSDYLELPEEVLMIAMGKHEKMFPVRDAEGKLLPEYLFVRNSGEDDSVRKGTAWVLSARFNDAKFFFDEDKRFTMDQFLEKTQGILFQAKLGTVRQRAERLSNLAGIVASDAPTEEQDWAKRAGLLAKADLSTGLVSELPALQGIIGAAYAKREGNPGAVCWAIKSHYDLSLNTGPRECSGERTGIRVTVADQLDKLAGYLGLGLQPSGSSDPYALRRAASQLIQAALVWHESFPSYDGLFRAALSGYAAQGIELDEDAATKAFHEVLSSRYGGELDVRYDILDATLALGSADPRSVRFRAQCLGALAEDTKLVQTATRPANILAAARKKGVAFAEEDALGAIDLPQLQSVEGLELYQALCERESEFETALASENVATVVRVITECVDPINGFFESTMMMVEDEAVLNARLTLLQATATMLGKLGDFTKIVIE